MENQINYGTVIGVPISSVLSETTIAKVEKQTYTTTNSTTTTNTTTNYSYYGVRQNVNVTTKSNSTPHFITKIYLTNGNVLSYEKDISVMEGWHIRQHFIYIKNHENLVFTYVPETGKFLNPHHDVYQIINPYFSLKKPRFWAKHLNHKISLLLSIPCLYYLLHIAFPKFFDFNLSWLIKGISLGSWTVLSIILTIHEIILNKRFFREELIRYNNAVNITNIENNQLKSELYPVIQQAAQIDQIFSKYGIQGLQKL